MTGYKSVGTSTRSVMRDAPSLEHLRELAYSFRQSPASFLTNNLLDTNKIQYILSPQASALNSPTG